MKIRITKIFLCLVVLSFLVSCASSGSMEKTTPSILDHNYILPVVAEDFEAYKWNETTQSAYKVYLRGLNEQFLILEYEQASDIFYSAIEIYNLDARFYVRLAEALARIGDYSRASSSLFLGNTRLPGLSEYPGIKEYSDELSRLLDNPELARSTASQPKGIVGKSIGILAWAPSKIWTGLKKLWIF